MLHPNGGAVWPGMALFVSIRLPACFHYHLGRFVWLEAHRATVACWIHCAEISGPI
jgi:hypothetical protein